MTSRFVEDYVRNEIKLVLIKALPKVASSVFRSFAKCETNPVLIRLNLMKISRHNQIFIFAKKWFQLKFQSKIQLRVWNYLIKLKKRMF
jgi:hypothetical protein